MGKIQKSNRHKKIKAIDPFYTGDRKLLLDKGLILANKVPTEKDDNPLCSKLREAQRYQQELAVKQKQATNKNKSKVNLFLQPDDKGAEVPLRSVSNLTKNTNESDASYLNRIDREIDTVIQRSRYEDQFEVKLETKDDKVVVKKEKKMRDGKRRTLEKLKDKKKIKRIQKSIDETEFVKDHVKFGEVVHNPPVITAFPKIRKQNIAQKLDPKQINESDRTAVMNRYKLLKSQGKFN